MVLKKIKNYGLYQTLSSENIKEKLIFSDKLKLSENIKNMTYEEKKAIFMLIYEHARLVDDFNYASEDSILPYSVIQDNDNVLIDFLKLPENLQIIIWRFSNIINIKKI
jgi:hypothetical protein